MLENVFILLIANFVEVIHVELANKGREITMPKVNRKNLLLKPVHIQDGEVGALFIPRDDAGVLIALNR